MPAQLARAVPILPVADARASSDYYCQVLGFQVAFEHQFEPGMPLFVSVCRDGVTIFLSEHKGEGAPNTLVYVYVDNVDALHKEIQPKGAQIASLPQSMPWGMREMIVHDPDLHILRFGSHENQSLLADPDRCEHRTV